VVDLPARESVLSRVAFDADPGRVGEVDLGGAYTKLGSLNFEAHSSGEKRTFSGTGGGGILPFVCVVCAWDGGTASTFTGLSRLPSMKPCVIGSEGGRLVVRPRVIGDARLPFRDCGEEFAKKPALPSNFPLQSLGEKVVSMFSVLLAFMLPVCDCFGMKGLLN